MKECNHFSFLLSSSNIIFTLYRPGYDVKPALFYRYGELQGLNKQETADRYGKEQVHEWRRSYDIPPPNGESLEMCAERAVAYFREHVRMNICLLNVYLFLFITSISIMTES